MNNRLCIFGEVLFDHFPDGQCVLGGAPFNVAWNLQALGEPVHFISRVGTDPEGNAVRQAMQSWGMQTAGLQTDDTLPTGRVSVELQDGEPSYDIVAPCAYDRIQPVTTHGNCRILYHGSLALRDPVSRATLDALLQDEPSVVFVDVNLRPPWWSVELVDDSLEGSDWAKLNYDELLDISGADQPPDADIGAVAADFRRSRGLECLIVTLGKDGAMIVTENEVARRAPVDIDSVKDTVGAGDAFSAVAIMGLTLGWPVDVTLDRAVAFASDVCGIRGATVFDKKMYEMRASEWRLL